MNGTFYRESLVFINLIKMNFLQIHSTSYTYVYNYNLIHFYINNFLVFKRVKEYSS